MNKVKLFSSEQKIDLIEPVSSITPSECYRIEPSDVKHEITFPLVDSSYDNQEILSCIGILLSGQMTMGKKVKCFEKKFSRYLHLLCNGVVCPTLRLSDKNSLMRQMIVFLFIVIVVPLVAAADDDLWIQAQKNADQAQEAFSRCKKLIYAWYRHTGADNKLLPRNLNERVWNAKDAAADLWSFYVIASYLTDKEAHDTFVRQTLIDEISMTTRLGSMIDDYLIDDNYFFRNQIDRYAVFFGASEYVKDGLLPIIELEGRTVFFERAREQLIDIMTNAPVKTKYGNIPSRNAEFCGEMMQCLSRMYCATGDPRFKKWAEQIGDAWFMEVLPDNKDLPCHEWDFVASRTRSDWLNFSDHGNEIILGLSELMMLEHVHDPKKAAQYAPAMRKMIDKLLAIAVNKDGLWVNSVQPTTGRIIHDNTPDTWGYALNAVYIMHLISGEEKYLNAVKRAMRGINADRKYLDWGRSDAFADSIESGIILYNRIREPETRKWLEKVTPIFLAKQREDGIIEGWHGDGNYARTAMMGAMMKTAGTRVSDWREDLKFGAVVKGKTLRVYINAEKPWKGKLHFDYPRHRMHVGLMINYPRLNEFPQWYTVEPTHLYMVNIDGKPRIPVLGDDLIAGLDIEINNQPVHVTVTPVAGPPYGAKPLTIKVAFYYGDDQKVNAPIVLHNYAEKTRKVAIKSSFGKISPARLVIPAGGEAKVNLTGQLTESTEVKIRVTCDDDDRSITRTVPLVYEKGLVGYIVFNDQNYKGTGYLWCGKKPIEFKLPACKGKAHTLQLLWGAKKSNRSGIVTINGHKQTVEAGGYDGFKWLALNIDPSLVKDESLDIRIEAASEDGSNAAFISMAKLTLQ